MRVAHRAKDGSGAKVKMPEYIPQSEDEALEYTSHLEEKAPEYTPQPRTRSHSIKLSQMMKWSKIILA